MAQNKPLVRQVAVVAVPGLSEQLFRNSGVRTLLPLDAKSQAL